MKKLNIAIIGCGRIAQRHAKHIKIPLVLTQKTKMPQWNSVEVAEFNIVFY